MLITNAIKIVGCALMLFIAASAARLRRRGPRRGRVLARQVRHPHRAPAAAAAGRRQRLDRGDDRRLDHPRHCSAACSSARASSARCSLRHAVHRHRHRHAARGRDRRDHGRLRDRRGLQLVHPATPASTTASRARTRSTSSASSRTACSLLWRDKLGQISLATTTLFWGAGATLQFIVIEWADHASSASTCRSASYMQGVVAVGIALGAVLAARFVSLRGAVSVLPIGVADGPRRDRDDLRPRTAGRAAADDR